MGHVFAPSFHFIVFERFCCCKINFIRFTRPLLKFQKLRKGKSLVAAQMKNQKMQIELVDICLKNWVEINNNYLLFNQVFSGIIPVQDLSI